MKRNANAHWKGTVKEGEGALSTESGALSNQPYGFNTRFNDGPGTNPEELLGAAHAGCFSMALAMALGDAGFTADSIATRATVRLDQQDDGAAITAIHLDITATVSDASSEDLEKCVNEAMNNCPVSKLFNTEITTDAELEG